MLPRAKEYEIFRDKVEKVLKQASKPLTWREIKVRADFEQTVPNPRWVKWMEEDIGLVREKSKTYWRLG